MSVFQQSEPMDHIFSGHSIFYYISKASSCNFWNTAIRNTGSDVTAVNGRGSDDTLQQPYEYSGCCLSCLQLIGIIRTEQQKLNSNDSRDRNNANTIPNVPVYTPPDAISNITGGTVLHALLQSYRSHCPQLVYTFLMDGNEYLTKPAIGATIGNGLRTMLLHRDRNEDLPIHIAAYMISNTSATISISLFQLLLHQTLLAQQQSISLFRNTFECQRRVGIYSRTFPTCSTVLSCNYLPPYILSPNRKMESILDIALLQYIRTHNGASNNVFQTNFVNRGSVEHKLYREMLQQVVKQFLSCDNNKLDMIHNHLMQWITIIIRAAFSEFLLIQQYCRQWQSSNDSTRNNSYRIRDRRPLDDIVKQLFSSVQDDDTYILHYASALCGPISGSFNSRKIQFMQVENSILELLLHRWGTDTIRSVHPITGQVPLHYAVQSYCSLLSTDHQGVKTQRNTNSCRLEFEYGSTYPCKIGFSLEWIRTLLRIYPEACMVQDHYGSTPLHYAILQTDREVATNDEKFRAMDTKTPDDFSYVSTLPPNSVGSDDTMPSDTAGGKDVSKLLNSNIGGDTGIVTRTTYRTVQPDEPISSSLLLAAEAMKENVWIYDSSYNGPTIVRSGNTSKRDKSLPKSIHIQKRKGKRK